MCWYSDMGSEWKLKVRQVRRFQDFRSVLGWTWEWELRKWINMGNDNDSGYYSPDLFDWHGRSRSEEDANAAVEACHGRLTTVRRKEFQWNEWYKDLEEE